MWLSFSFVFKIRLETVRLFANNRINIVTLKGTSQFVPDVTNEQGGRRSPERGWYFKDQCAFENSLSILDCVLSILPFDCREGSVITDFLLDIVRGTSSDIEGMLQNAINDVQFGNAVVESFGEVKGLFRKSEERLSLCCHIFFVCLFFRPFNFIFSICLQI